LDPTRSGALPGAIKTKSDFRYHSSPNGDLSAILLQSRCSHRGKFIEALRCTPHSTLVEQPYSADPKQRKDVLALTQTGTTRRAASRAAWRRNADPEESLRGAFGAIALAEGRSEDAIGEYRVLRDSAPGCALCALYELGLAYEQAGQVDSAIAMYERYLRVPSFRRVYFDKFNLVPVLRRVAALHEQLGNRERAIEHYSRILDLWKDADAELQLHVTDDDARSWSLRDERADVLL
jgi:tetratricopeptide (TPR) repeat protein